MSGRHPKVIPRSRRQHGRDGRATGLRELPPLQIGLTSPYENRIVAPAASKSSRFPWATFLLASFAFLPFLVPRAGSVLAYDRRAIATGQIWRILTCHWTHYSASHLFWDLGTFILLGMVCELRDRARMIAVVIGSAVLLPIALWWLMPHLPTYRGLSGIDCALFILAAGNLARESSRPAHRRSLAPFARLLVVLFLIKLIVECVTNRAVFADSSSAGFVPVPMAHLIGAIVGALVHFGKSSQLRASPA